MNLTGLDAAESDLARFVFGDLGLRLCSACEEVKPLDEFPGDGKGTQTHCRVCNALTQRRKRAVTYRREIRGRGFVYRFRDADGRLLYVGLTRNPEARFYGTAYPWADGSAHDLKPWWPEVAEISVSTFATYAEADAAESWAIRHEKPLYNRARKRLPECCPRPLSTVRGEPLST